MSKLLGCNDDRQLNIASKQQKELAQFWGGDVTQLSPGVQQLLLEVIKKLHNDKSS